MSTKQFKRKPFPSAPWLTRASLSILFWMVLSIASAQCTNGVVNFTWDGAGFGNEAVVLRDDIIPAGTEIVTSITECSTPIAVKISLEDPDNVYYSNNIDGSDTSGTTGTFAQPGFNFWLDNNNNLFDNNAMDLDEEASLVLEFSVPVSLENIIVEDIDWRNRTISSRWRDEVTLTATDATGADVPLTATKVNSASTISINGQTALAFYETTSGDDDGGLDVTDDLGHVTWSSTATFTKLKITYVSGVGNAGQQIVRIGNAVFDADADNDGTLNGFSSIGNLVWYDLDGDGGFDNSEGEFGIEGVNVSLFDGTCGSGGSQIGSSVQTNSSGEYQFDNVPQNADYCVVVDESSLDVGGETTGFVSTTGGNEIDVSLGTTDNLDADFGYVYLRAQCYPTIDFSVDADGNVFQPTIGGFRQPFIDVSNAWSKWGITISASTGQGPALFDTNNPGMGNDGADPDLGSPYNVCIANGGGCAGGAPGEPGANFPPTPLNNIVIIQEAGVSTPDDNANGGILTFTFAGAVEVTELFELDSEDFDAGVEVRTYDVTSGGTATSTTPVLGLGDNSFQIISVGATNVRRLEFDFASSSGGIGQLSFCETTASNTASVGDFVFEDHNGNGVQNTGEEGLEDVTVGLYTAGGNLVLPEVETDADGLYGFSELPAGN